jgi:RHS repeat-associated protein
VESYTYDLNGNRLTRLIGSGITETARYDAQDRLVERGELAYTFDADGFLQARGADRFVYSARGELLSATVGDTTITYAYDDVGRRVARTDSAGTTSYLYGNPERPFEVSHVRDAAGVLSSYYYDEAGLLFAFERAGARYYVATDALGTPHVVSDASGAPVKVLEFDSYGVPLSDSAPNFLLPFGFQGGLADAVTGLVRFGMRDYEPASGRWTARDPLLFSAGQLNLYAFVGNNPVSAMDPAGLFAIGLGFTGYAGGGGGLSLSISSSGAVGGCIEVGAGFGGGPEVSWGEPSSESSGGLEFSYGIANSGFGMQGGKDSGLYSNVPALIATVRDLLSGSGLGTGLSSSPVGKGMKGLKQAALRSPGAKAFFKKCGKVDLFTPTCTPGAPAPTPAPPPPRR